jgi:hypothetical protein
MTSLLARALLSGSVAAAAVTLVASAAGRRTTGAYAAPLNATSHFLWGERAGRRNDYSLKYTATGFTANYGASVFWALFYEALAGRMPPLVRGAAVSALAYATDYHVVPKRLTPGFEMRLPGRALAAIYAALAVGLSARDLLSRTRR